MEVSASATRSAGAQTNLTFDKPSQSASPEERISLLRYLKETILPAMVERAESDPRQGCVALLKIHNDYDGSIREYLLNNRILMPSSSRILNGNPPFEERLKVVIEHLDPSLANVTICHDHMSLVIQINTSP